ncbi:MAG: ABC transporter ATP-binding protein [Dyadobacter sp.]|uniref:ABC transporter ATP-binding protein n=1 Tax=Dyadobacter sp. TaxID=1914288 RepID=UPI003267CE4F
MSGTFPLLETRNLTIGYASKKSARMIAENLNLQLWPGQLVCLLGSNGTGKSTLMRTLAGLQPALKGEVIIDHHLLSTLKAADLAQKLSLVLTERVEAGNLTAKEVIELGRTPYTGWLGKLSESDHEKIHRAIQSADVVPLLTQRMHQLSDGERQKIMLARALAQDTELILLDEPTAHLDLPNRVEMMRLLHTLARKTNKAILLSTHELDLALQAADNLWLMQPDGKLVTGVPEDLVLNGAFESAFAKTGFFFDNATGTFTIHHDPGSVNIGLSGDPKMVFWTNRALQREGFRSNHQEDFEYQIIVSTDNGTPVWKFLNGEFASKFTTIEMLIDSVKSVANKYSTT